MLTLSDSTVFVLLGTTASLAALHAVLGVDHSLPFIVLGRARGWSLKARRLLRILLAC